MQEELRTCNRILLDRRGILANFMSLSNGKVYKIGSAKEACDLPITIDF